MKHRGIVTPAPGGLIEKGPLMQITIAPPMAVRSFLQSQGQPVDAHVAKMMIDTGAELTVVERVILEGLGLPPIRFIPIVGVSQKAEDCPVYRASISFAAGRGNDRVDLELEFDVVGMASPPHPAEHVGLIGRDFLSKFHLAYDGPGGMFDLIIPDALLKAAGIRPGSRAQRRAEAKRDRKNKKKRRR